MKDITLIIIIVVIVLGALYLMNTIKLPNAQSTNNQTMSVLQIVKEKIVPSKPDLRPIFQPYWTANPNADKTCELRGGTWHWTHDFVGCYQTSVPVIDCSVAELQAAVLQCSGLGAVSKCDVNNAYCKYN